MSTASSVLFLARQSISPDGTVSPHLLGERHKDCLKDCLKDDVTFTLHWLVALGRIPMKIGSTFEIETSGRERRALSESN